MRTLPDKRERGPAGEGGDAPDAVRQVAQVRDPGADRPGDRGRKAPAQRPPSTRTRGRRGGAIAPDPVGLGGSPRPFPVHGAPGTSVARASAFRPSRIRASPRARRHRHRVDPRALPRPPDFPALPTPPGASSAPPSGLLRVFARGRPAAGGGDEGDRLPASGGRGRPAGRPAGRGADPRPPTTGDEGRGASSPGDRGVRRRSSFSPFCRL